MFNTSRRKFLNYSFKTMAAAGATGILGRLGTMTAYATGNSSNSNYKALVCVFLYGGNDGHNTLIPIATPAQTYTNYATARSSLALPQGQLWPIAAGAGNTYGLHPKLKEIQGLYGLGKAAFLANVGSLVVKTTRPQYLQQSVQLPDSLFSHSNQQNQWQTASPHDFATAGWGGRAADILASANINAPSQFPMIVNAGGGSLFSAGAATNPTTVQPGGSLGLNSTGLSSRSTAYQQLLSFDNGLQLMQASNSITTRGINDAALLKVALGSAPTLHTVFPASTLGAQMKLVAQILSVRGALSMNRQIFFVSLGGFDTHSNQLPDQDALLQDVSQSLNALYTATVEMGVDQSVTAFTNSEFGRTLQPSSGGGTDHAWGSHAMIVGGAVHGGALYGTFPSLAFGGPDDANTRGTLIPTTSVEQYGATLAKWFGVTPTDIPTVFPGLGATFAPDLGFMG